MTAPIDPIKTLERNYELILRICSMHAYRHGLAPSEVDEFSSWAVEQLVEGDYATLRKFAGHGSFKAFLSTTLGRLCQDYRNRFWGRWRPSAIARRLGEIAVRLERMVYRDRMSVGDAVAALNGDGTGVDTASVRETLAQLPIRWARSTTPLEDDRIAADIGADDGLWDSERDRTLAWCRGILGEVLGRLDAEEQIIVRMLYQDERSIADIARALHIEQKPLYRRVERLRTTLRTALEQRGVTRDQLSILFDEPGGH